MSFSTDTFLEHQNKFVRRSFSSSIRHHPLPSTCIHHNTPYPFLAEAGSNINCSDGSHLHRPSAVTNIKEFNTSNNYSIAASTGVPINNNNNCNIAYSCIPLFSNSNTPALSTSCSGLCSLHPPLSPHLWGTLPQEIVENILAFLPIPTIFRFSRVCKSWRELFYSRSFLRLRAGITNNGTSHLRQRAYFLALNRSRYQQLTAYEVISKTWCCFPLSFLPMVAYPVSAAGGLICFLSANLDTGYTTFIVCNPVTRRWKELPSMIHKTVPFSISMVVDRKSMTYRILVAGGVEGSNTYRRTTEIYDSAVGNWIHCSSIPQDEDISRSIVEYGGYYLCLTRGPRSGLLAFNLQKQAWAKMRTSKIPGYSKFRHLVECGGSILVIGKALRRYVLGLYIWCLDPTTLRWREVGKMPRVMCEQFFSSPSECFYCTAQGHLIFFCRYYYNQGLVYNMVDNSWQHVAECPLLTHPLLLPFDPGLDPVD